MKWGESEDEILRQYSGVITAEEIKRTMLSHRSLDSILSRAKRLGLHSTLTFNQHNSPNIPKPNFLNKEKMGKVSPESLQSLWDELYQFQSKSFVMSSRLDEANIQIDTDNPIAIGFLSDAHIGAISCKYKEFEDRIQLMADTPNFYVINCGDSIDNYLPTWHSAGMFGELIPPELQKVLVEHQFKKLKGRWLASVQGCHEEPSHVADDFDFNKWLCSELECANLGFGGFINIMVGKITYRIHARHKYRFNSAFNLTNTVKRLREQVGDFDIGAIGHHHQASVEQLSMPDKDRIFIRPGSFKAPDRWARSIGFYDTGAFVPTVILYPDKRLMLPFLHLEQAFRFLSCVHTNA